MRNTGRHSVISSLELILLWLVGTSWTRTVDCLSLSSPWGYFPIDCSGANEYVAAHYGSTVTKGDSDSVGNYLPFDNDLVPVWNGRERHCSLEDDGFVLKRIEERTTVTDWNNREEVRVGYIPQLRKLLMDEYGDELLHIVFWHSMVRGEELTKSQRQDGLSSTTPTSSVASLVHIDTDVGAYTLDQLMSLIGNNRVDTAGCLQEHAEDIVGMDKVEHLVSDGHRFAIVNAWRNIRPEPVQSAPLALLRPVYGMENTNNKDSSPTCFPKSHPDPERSRWFTFPEMTNEEVLLFKQYDRRLDRCSDIWHCALSTDQTPNDGIPPRLSFDIRAFCVFRSRFSDDTGGSAKWLDRYGESRIRPGLSLEESECFCHEQGKQRRESNKKTE